MVCRRNVERENIYGKMPKGKKSKEKIRKRKKDEYKDLATTTSFDLAKGSSSGGFYTASFYR